MASDTGATRKLASIVAIDVAGYSRRTETDEAAAVRAVAALRERINESAGARGGRVFNTAGDGFMLEFPSVYSALEAAEEIASADDPQVRVGVHLGDVSVTPSGDLLGHGVNVAARIQQMASPGAVLASGDVRRAIRGTLGERLKPQGSVRLEKMTEVVPIFALASAEGGKVKGRRLKLPMLPLAVAIAVVAVAALGWFASQQFWSGPPAQRIAIVPFSTLGGGEEVKAFASAVTDDLASVLSGNGRPIVTGDDAQALTGPGGADRIHRLGVRLIFGGTVAREADQLKVRVRLDDARQGVTLWTAALDGPAARSEQLQAQLGARIIAVLNCTSRALRPKGGLSDPDAMTLLLKACDIFEDQVGAGDDPQQIFALLDTSRQLTQKAPGFAAGHSLLAKFDAYYRNYLPPAMNEPLATEAKLEIDKALRIDPADIDAHVALYLLRPTSDFVGRDRAIMGASFDPSWAYGEIFRGAFLQDVGREQEGLVAYQRAVAANPLSADQDLVLPLTMTGQISEAKQELARISRLWPLPWIERFNLYQADHDWSGLQAFLDTPSQQPKILTAANIDRLKLVVTAARTRAPRDLARARTALMDLPPGAPIPLGDRVLQLSWLGFVDDAFSLANRASRDDLSPSNPPTVLFMPQALPMRQDRRFMALAARWGLVDYWTRTGKWPDFCSGPGLPYDCKSEAAKLAGKRS